MTNLQISIECSFIEISLRFIRSISDRTFRHGGTRRRDQAPLPTVGFRVTISLCLSYIIFHGRIRLSRGYVRLVSWLSPFTSRFFGIDATTGSISTFPWPSCVRSRSVQPLPVFQFFRLRMLAAHEVEIPGMSHPTRHSCGLQGIDRLRMVSVTWLVSSEHVALTLHILSLHSPPRNMREDMQDRVNKFHYCREGRQ